MYREGDLLETETDLTLYAVFKESRRIPAHGSPPLHILKLWRFYRFAFCTSQNQYGFCQRSTGLPGSANQSMIRKQRAFISLRQ